jgi:3-hydroxyisobutyrate dehydrogenase-like beta-hydroxyacid dehydrogenase
MARVGILGTGRMGSAMARSLARSDHELVLYNRTAASARALADELGSSVAPSPAAAVADVDVALTMLADGAAVTAMYRADGGILDGVHDGLVLLEMSTVEPAVSRSLAPDVDARGGSLLDAPVSGSVSLAEGGQLTVMVGGDAAALDRARPVLDGVATRVFHVGPVGTGAATKLAVNVLIFALDVAVSEAIVLAERAGVERAVAYDVLQNSAVGAPFVAYKRAAFLDPETTPTGFSLELAAKDLGLIIGLAEASAVPVDQARANLAVIEASAAAVGPERDFALVAEHLRANARATGREAPPH